MFIVELLLALFVALLLSVILSVGMGWQRPRARSGAVSLIFLFVILFLVTWALGAWARPFGPMMYGVHWTPFVVAGILVAVILAAVVPPRPRTRREALERAEIEAGAEAVLGAFFWLLVVVLAIALVTHYLWHI